MKISLFKHTAAEPEKTPETSPVPEAPATPQAPQPAPAPETPQLRPVDEQDVSENMLSALKFKTYIETFFLSKDMEVEVEISKNSTSLSARILNPDKIITQRDVMKAAVELEEAAELWTLSDEPLTSSQTDFTLVFIKRLG